MSKPLRYRRLRTLPDGLPTGSLNLISDVPGIRVGHHTIWEEAPRILRTGVTALTIPNVVAQPVAAATHVFNGFGKSLGLMQIDELGTMESPVYLTNTLSVGAVHQGAVAVAQRERSPLRTYNPIVMECNDGRLSDIDALAVTPAMAALAHDAATENFELGSVGAGTGMICFGHKGGIGSSSRCIEVAGNEFTVGALVLSNFGRREDLRLPGTALSLAPGVMDGNGSLILIVATDLPLMPHQLRRVARHAALCIGQLGTPGYHGSGDVVVAFSTGLRLGSGEAMRSANIIANDGEAMNLAFRAAAWSCTEAILDSMLASPAVKGLRAEVPSLADEPAIH
jgi:D-aminopeptidase